MAASASRRASGPALLCRGRVRGVWSAAWIVVLLSLLTPVTVLPLYAQPTHASETYDFTVSKGLLEFGKGRYEVAAGLFRKALEAKPRDVHARELLGQALLRLKRYEEAERIFAELVVEHPRSEEGLVGLGLSQLKQHDYESARKILDLAAADSPDNPLIPYYQGLTHLGLGAFEEAPALFTRAMNLSPDLRAPARYYMGVAYYELGRIQEAQREFKAALALGDPESELSRSARAFLTERVALQREPRRWDLSFQASEQYDDNVVLLPLGTQPSPETGISRKDDYVTNLFARGAVRVVQTDVWTIGASYAFSQSFHRTLSGFDVESHAPSGYVQHRMGPVFARIQYEYDYVKVGRAPFLIANGVQPMVTIVEGENLFTQLRFQYRDKDFQHGRFPSNSARDGKNWLAGVSQYLFFANGDGNVRIGYTFDTDRTGGGNPQVAVPGRQTNADWAYQGHSLSAGLDLPPLLSIKPSVAFDYYWQQYDNPSSFSPSGMTRRKDEILFVAARLRRELGDVLAVSFEYNYTRDQSNLAVFDYARNRFGLTLGVKF